MVQWKWAFGSVGWNCVKISLKHLLSHFYTNFIIRYAITQAQKLFGLECRRSDKWSEQEVGHMHYYIRFRVTSYLTYTHAHTHTRTHARAHTKVHRSGMTKYCCDGAQYFPHINCSSYPCIQKCLSICTRTHTHTHTHWHTQHSVRLCGLTGHQYMTSSMSPFWHLKFGCGSYSFV